MRIGARPFCLLLAAPVLSVVVMGQATEYSALVAGTDRSVCTVDHLAKGEHQRCAIKVSISQRRNGMERKLTLPIEVATVDSVGISPGGRLIVLGEGPTKFSRFLVYEIATQHLLTNRLCYFPALSPNGSWIAYQRFIPPHGMEPLAVDLEIYSVDSVGGTQAKTYSVYRDSDGSWMTSTPLWSPKSNFVLLGIGAAIPPKLVLLRRTPNGRAPFTASIKSMDVEEICKGNESRQKKSTGCNLTVERADFNKSTRRVVITFKRFGALGYDQKSVAYSLSAFTPATNESGKTELH